MASRLPKLELYTGEARLLAVRILRNGSPVTPDAATITILGSGRTTVLKETTAGISGNRVYFLIGPHNITDDAGGYILVWKAVYGDEVFVATQTVVVEAP